MKFGLLVIIASLGLIFVAIEAVCPDGYCRHSGDCYLVVGLNVSWIDARAYCTTLGGFLLHIDSQSKQTTTEGVLRRSLGIYPAKFWIDVSDLLNPTDWKYMQLKQSITYSNWNTDEADNSSTVVGKCVSLSRENEYAWSPTACEQKMNFVCFHSGIEERVRVYDRYRYSRYEMVDKTENDTLCEFDYM
ncbi:hypothetical protein ACF0H5_002641 [Mactra antiquata]